MPEYYMELLCAIENCDIDMVNKLLTLVDNAHYDYNFIIDAIKTCNLQIIQPFLQILHHTQGLLVCGSLRDDTNYTYTHVIEHTLKTHNEEVIKLIFDTLSENNEFLS